MLPPEGNGFELRNSSNQLPSTILALISYTFLKGKKPQQLTFHTHTRKTPDQFSIGGTWIILGHKNEGLCDPVMGFTKSSEKARKTCVNIAELSWPSSACLSFPICEMGAITPRGGSGCGMDGRRRRAEELRSHTARTGCRKSSTEDAAHEASSDAHQLGVGLVAGVGGRDSLGWFVFLQKPQCSHFHPKQNEIGLKALNSSATKAWSCIQPHFSPHLRFGCHVGSK